MSKLIKFGLVLLLVIILQGVSVFECLAAAGTTERSDAMPLHTQAGMISQDRPDRGLDKIIQSLESRMRNHQLPEKVKNKLAAMNDEDLRLVTTLCDRMSGAGADVAFLLATALIVLS